VIVNKAFIDAYNIDLNEDNNIDLKFSSYYLKNEKNIELNYETSLTITEVVEEFYYLESPKVYYSYSYFSSLLKEKKILNSNNSYLDLVIQSNNDSEISAYSYLVNIYPIDFDRFLQLDSDFLSFSNDAKTYSSSFNDLSSIIFLSINIFFIINICCVIFITSFLSIYNYLINKKEKAILYCYGASKVDISLTYILENIIVFILSFFISAPFSNKINNFVGNLIKELTKIPLNVEKINLVTITFIFILFLVTIFFSSYIPFSYSFNRLDLASELKEE